MSLLEVARRPGAGSLMLIGGTSGQWRTTDPIDREAVALAPRDRPIAFIPAAACPPDYGETFLDAYQRLGASQGYVVPIHDRLSARNPRNAQMVREAGLIYFGGGETTVLLESMTDTPVLDAVVSAYVSGSVIVGMSAGAIALCAWGVPQDPDIGLLQGWGWLPGMIVSVHHTPARDTLLERAVRDRPGMIGLALAEDVAIVLRHGDGVRTLGASQPTFFPAKE